MLPFEHQKFIMVSPINIRVKKLKYYMVLEKFKIINLKVKRKIFFKCILFEIISVPTLMDHPV